MVELTKVVPILGLRRQTMTAPVASAPSAADAANIRLILRMPSLLPGHRLRTGRRA